MGGRSGPLDIHFLTDGGSSVASAQHSDKLDLVRVGLDSYGARPEQSGVAKAPRDSKEKVRRGMQRALRLKDTTGEAFAMRGRSSGGGGGLGPEPAPSGGRFAMESHLGRGTTVTRVAAPRRAP